MERWAKFCVGIACVGAFGCGEVEQKEPVYVDLDEEPDAEANSGEADSGHKAARAEPTHEPVEPARLPVYDRKIVVEGDDAGSSDYVIEITGEFRASELEDDDRVAGALAEGQVDADGERDVYEFSGDLARFEVSGSARLYIDDLLVKGDADATHDVIVEGMDYSRSDFELRTTPQANLRAGDDLENSDEIAGDEASGFVQAPATDTFVLDGGLERLQVQGTARVYFDGQVIVGTPRKRLFRGYDAPTIEVTLYSSKGVLRNNGRVTEEMVALHAARAFDQAQFNYEVTYNFSAQEPADETSHCSGEATGWWKNRLADAAVELRAKDSNVLLTSANGGGCGSVGGWYATTPGGNIDEVRPWSQTGSDRWSANIHANLHEIGHNLGARHDHDRSMDGQQHWGIGWNEWHDDEDKGYWHRTPNVAGNGAPNGCGTDIEAREYDDVMRHQVYNPCAIDRFDIK